MNDHRRQEYDEVLYCVCATLIYLPSISCFKPRSIKPEQRCLNKIELTLLSTRTYTDTRTHTAHTYNTQTMVSMFLAGLYTFKHECLRNAPEFVYPAAPSFAAAFRP